MVPPAQYVLAGLVERRWPIVCFILFPKNKDDDNAQCRGGRFAPEAQIIFCSLRVCVKLKNGSEKRGVLVMMMMMSSCRRK
jgi:hypothetical protein